METDRSRILAAQRCPRERYLAYRHLGTGLQKKSKGLPLQFGSAFHEGSEVLLWPQVSPDNKVRIEIAVNTAKKFLRTQFEVSAISFEGETPDDLQKAMEYGQEEQMALAEGLLRGWWAYEGEAFLENFDVIEVEQEGRASLTEIDARISTGPNRNDYRDEIIPGLVLMFRPDALVRDKQSGDLYVISWKTCATFQKRNIDQAKHDMQSISEVFGVEQLMDLQSANEAKEMANKLGTSVVWGTNGTRVEGVLYKWIVKGQRRKDNWDGLYKQSSHLIYGWKKLGNGGGDEAEWSWAYEFEKEDGSGSSRLGKGWKRVPIWREYPGGVKQWVEDLSTNQIFPRHIDALQAIFPQSLPVERRKDEVESWKRQIVEQEQIIQRKLEYIGTDPDKDDLDRAFPQ